MIETPTKQGYVTPISGYKNRMTKSVSLQSGIAQVEREQRRATTEPSLAARTTTSQNSEIHKSHSDEELLNSSRGDKKIERIHVQTKAVIQSNRTPWRLHRKV